MNAVLSPNGNCDRMAPEGHSGIALLTREDLERMERQLIPLLNTVRQLQGKRPVIVPGEKRTHA